MPIEIIVDAIKDNVIGFPEELLPDLVGKPFVKSRVTFTQLLRLQTHQPEMPRAQGSRPFHNAMRLREDERIATRDTDQLERIHLPQHHPLPNVLHRATEALDTVQQPRRIQTRGGMDSNVARPLELVPPPSPDVHAVLAKPRAIQRCRVETQQFKVPGKEIYGIGRTTHHRIHTDTPVREMLGRIRTEMMRFPQHNGPPILARNTKKSKQQAGKWY
jgi:hypothetical protein